MKRLLLLLTLLLLTPNFSWGATYTDAFPQGDEDPLSSSGVWQGGYTGYGNLQVISNAVTASAVGPDERMTVSTVVPGANQYGQLKLSTWNPGNYSVGAFILLRWGGPPSGDGIKVIILHQDDIQGDKIWLYDNVDFVAGTSLTIAQGDTFRAEVSGSTVTVYQCAPGCTQRLQAVVAGPASGRIGMGAYISEGLTSQLGMDDFEGGDIGAAPSVVLKRRAIMIQ